MRAMVVTKFGPPEVLQPQQIPQPRPGPTDLLIEVHAAALNPIDFKIRLGAFGKGRKFPFPLGYDVSGVVREMGPEVVMQMVEERAPGGVDNLHDVITQGELEEVAARYKIVAGFDRDSLRRNGRSTPPAPEGA